MFKALGKLNLVHLLSYNNNKFILDLFINADAVVIEIMRCLLQSGHAECCTLVFVLLAN